MNEQHGGHVDNLIDAYALGALEPDETAQVEAHLERCARCHRLAATARATAAALLYAAPLVEPPAGLRAKIIDRVHAVAAEEQRTLPGMRPREPIGGGGQSSRAGLRRVLAGLLGREQRANDRAARRLAELLAHPDSAIWEVAGTEEAPEARARLVGVPGERDAVLITGGLRPLARERVYQVWLLRGGQPLPNALFRVGPGGDSRQIIHAPQPLGDFEVVAVTPEPASGSPSPTGPIVLAGSLAP
jgi:anti-sigma-K factor RskA